MKDYFDREDIDCKAYNAKTALVNRMRKAEVPDGTEYKQMLKDITSFSYWFLRVDGEPLKLYPYQDLILNDKHRFKIFRSANQTGKLQGYSDIVYTPTGPREMGSLKIGDLVFGEDGQAHPIIKIFEQGKKALYKLTFDDGSSCRCGMEHLWKFIHPKNRFKHIDGRKSNKYHNKYMIKTLREIIDIDGYNPRPIKRIAIPVCEPVQFEERGYDIHPYVMGVLLGDGSITTKSIVITGDEKDKEIIERCSKLLNRKIKRHSDKKTCLIHNSKNIVESLKKLNLFGTRSHTKFIPNLYKYTSVKKRIEILRGLMDTDGSIYDKCNCEFTSTSKQLAYDVKEIVCGLGGKAKIKEKDTHYLKNGVRIKCKKAYRVFVKLESINPFFLKRKADKHYKIRYRKERILRKIEYDDIEECRCILIDSKDHTYLTDNFIVTHNSLALDVKAVYNLLMDHGHSHNEAIVSKSLPQSIYQMRRVKGLLKTANFIDWKAESGDADSLQVITCNIMDEKGKKTKYTNMLVCAPCTEGLLGYDLHELNLDEFEYWETDIKWFFNQIAQPRTYHTNGNITIFSNPNGQDCFVADLEKQRLKESGELKWHTYIFNYLDKPGNTQQEYDQLQHELSRQEFESTVAAIRSSSDRNYFTPDEIERSYDKTLSETKMIGKQPFFFLDVGAKHDKSFLSGGFIEPDEENEKFNHLFIPILHSYPEGYPLNRVVGSEVDEGDGWHYEKSVKEYLQEWGKGGIIPIFGVDATGNSGIVPLFEAVGIDAVDVTFSGPSKSGYYQRMKYFFEKGLLHRVKSKQFESEMAQLVVTKSKRGYLLINAGWWDTKGKKQEEQKMKGIPDDCCDSVAGLIYISDPADYVEPTLQTI